MSRCASLVRSPSHAAAWSRCTRRARLGLLCREHRDALDGAFMGILHANKTSHASPAETRHPGLLAAADAENALKNALAVLIAARKAEEGRGQATPVGEAALEASAHR